MRSFEEIKGTFIEKSKELFRILDLSFEHIDDTNFNEF